MKALSDDIAIMGTSENLVRVQFRNLYVMRWVGECTGVELDAVFFDMQSLSAARGGIAIVSWLDQGALPPTNEERTRVAEQQNALGSKLLALAVLVDGQGFWASAALNVVLNIRRLSPKEGNQRVFRKRADACVWLSGYVEGAPTTGQLDAVLSRCRAPEGATTAEVLRG